MKYRITDHQAFLGGIAMIIIGFVLFIKCIIYINIEYYGPEITRSRWLWEFTLSMQILSFAFMWAAHHARVIGATGRWKKRAIIHAFFGLAAVSMPVFLMLMAVYLDWFLYPPPSVVAKQLIHIAAVIWLFSNVVVPITLGVIYRDGVWALFVNNSVYVALMLLLKRYWPGILMIAGIMLSAILNNNIGYIFSPLLGYFQASYGYFTKAFKPETVAKPRHESL